MGRTQERASRLRGARLVVTAVLHQPENDVATTVAPRHAAIAAGGEEDLAAAERKILGDLAAGVAAADHEHGAGSEVACVAVVRAVDLSDTRRQPGGKRRTFRDIEIAGGGNDVAGLDDALRRMDVEAAAGVWLDGVHGSSALQRQRLTVGIGQHRRDKFVPGHGAFGTRAAVGLARHHREQVRGVHPEAVPPLGQPSLARAAFLEYHVAKSGGLQCAADGKPGESTADNHSVKHVSTVRHAPPLRPVHSFRLHLSRHKRTRLVGCTRQRSRDFQNWGFRFALAI